MCFRLTEEIFEENALGAGQPLLVACVEGDALRQDQELLLKEASLRLKDRMDIRVCTWAEDRWFMERHKITGTPTYVLFTDGEERDRLLGKSSLEELVKFAETAIDDSRDLG